MSELKVSIVQAELKWHDVDANLAHMSELLTKVKDADLILLPEMWTTGFTMMAHRYYSETPRAVQSMQNWASEKEATLIGSIITKEGDQCYNRLYCIDSSGVVAHYDKRHLFAFAGEDRSFKGGRQQKEIIVNGFTIRLNVCYDLRFPVWARNDSDYDILLYVANWPDKRIDAWSTLLKARAIENQAYVLGCNCAGEDLWSNTYSGQSGILAPDGQILATAEGESILSHTIGREKLTAFRRKFPFLKDRDQFDLAL